VADTVFGLFDHWNEARSAVHALHGAGFTEDRINIIARDHRQAEKLADSEGGHVSGVDAGHAADGSYLGAAAGSMMGGAAGWALGLGALAIPGVGPLLAAGPIIGALTGFAAGAGAGGLLGMLVGSGIPDEHAAHYDRAVREGKIAIAVLADDRAGEARRILDETGAEYVEQSTQEITTSSRGTISPEPVTAASTLPDHDTTLRQECAEDSAEAGLGEDIDPGEAYRPIHSRSGF
jgi:hypothetical protein